MVKSNIIIPQHLRNGDLVGIAAISGPVNPTDLEKGIAFIEALQLRTKLSENIVSRIDYLAGPDESRVKSLNEFLVDPEIRGIIFARGGYGATRVLPKINFEAMKKDPKIIVGMSDITSLSLAAFTTVGLVSVAGPMLAGQMANQLDDVTSACLVRAVLQPLRQYEMAGKFTSETRILRSGKATGPLLGGCLSLIVSLLGTPFSPNFSGSVLFIEEVNEPPYKIDRMLTQMKLAGIFEVVRGVIIAHVSGDDSDISRSKVEELILDYTASSSVPVISNYPHGHELPNVSLPVGADVELVVSQRGLIFRVI